MVIALCYGKSKRPQKYTVDRGSKRWFHIDFFCSENSATKFKTKAFTFCNEQIISLLNEIVRLQKKYLSYTK